MSSPEISIQELVGLGEGQTLEFKKSLSLMKEGFVALCAMVNADTGYGRVVFGVDPSTNVCGLEDVNLDSAQQKLSLFAKQRFDPPLAVEAHPVLCEGRAVLIVSARRYKGTPFHEYDGRAYMRVGSVSNQLSVADKQKLLVSRNRDLHNGPWICDKCGTYVGSLSIVEFTEHGPRKSYKDGCGGEFWPAA